jgi:V8-like Glu-specific endopeptidase
MTGLDDSGGFMHRIRTLLIAGATTTMLAACAHPGTQSASSGDISIDSLSATKTAILRVQNNYPSEVRVYSVIGGQLNYIAKAMPGETRSFVLDPNQFPNDAISFEMHGTSGSDTSRVGPFKVNRGETVELVVPANLAQARATVHKSTP